jgi:hypothetical protein
MKDCSEEKNRGLNGRKAIISLYSINVSVCITEAESVYCAVRTGSLNATDPVSSL